MPKGPLIIDESKNKEDDKWLVHPSPGFCVKFKNVQFPNCSLQNEIYNKLFINIAHCIEIPPPKQQFLSEDEVAQLLATDLNAYQIPICVGNLDKVIDNKGKTEIKIDVLVNSNFFHKCINESELFRQITLQIINEAIKSKFGISINICEQIILRNKKCMGQLNAQYIHKRPLNSIMDLGGKMNGGENAKLAVEMNDENATKIDIDDIEEMESGSRKPRNFKAQILKGQTMEIKIKVKDSDGNSVHQIDRIGIKMNEDRAVILLDSEQIVADFFLLFRIKDEEAICQFHEGTSTITINCPVNWE